ncbi:MAG: flagellar protein FlaG [Clostridiales bacterium]|jgi:flagellar protein FlaG|nr:flagellar protein FlaG [Clostridiales bacterium]
MDVAVVEHESYVKDEKAKETRKAVSKPEAKTAPKAEPANLSRETEAEIAEKAKKELEAAAAKANKKLDDASRYLEYSVHKKLHQIVIKLKDSKTGETIKEFPPENRLDAVARMLELAGLLVDSKR